MQKRGKRSTKRSKRSTKRSTKTQRRSRHLRRRIRGGDYTQQTDADIDGLDVDSSDVSITTEGVSRPYREFLEFAERRSVSGSEN